MRKVKIVKREGKAVLVEWMDDDGHYRRGALPPGAVEKDLCSDAELDRSIAYGEPWAELLEWPTVEEMAQELYRHNLWSFHDILDNAEAIRGVIMKPFENVLVSLLRLAKENK